MLSTMSTIFGFSSLAARQLRAKNLLDAETLTTRAFTSLFEETHVSEAAL